MSLRRSVRAVPAQTPARTASSASSHLSQKQASPQNSIPPNSPSPPDADSVTNISPRRTRSSNDDVKEIPTTVAPEVKTAVNEEEEDDEQEEEEEEETRCICGQLEYPGLPVINSTGPKDQAADNPDPISEDSTGWFIQCDDCQVWQHGGCVGILDERQCPDKYYCEQCRNELHVISKDVNGRRYSRYQPAQEREDSNESSESKVNGNSKRTRERLPRSELDLLAKGRRATMNSRDSGYDEAEQLRRAIEESKKDSMAKTDPVRRVKRGRSDSEGPEDGVKRRRTGSGSLSSQSKNQHHQEGSEGEEPRRTANHKVVRGAAARNHRAKELRGGEAREKERPESRKGRNQYTKRKTDNPDNSPEPTSRNASTRAASQSTKAQATATKSHKKGGRPPARKGRLGRNQYTKDRNTKQAPSVLSPHSNNSHEGEVSYTNGVHGNGIAESNGLGKPSRPRQMNLNRTTLNEMKRRVAGILEFISHTQVEMAGLDNAKPRISSDKGRQEMQPTSERGDEEGQVAKDINGVLEALGDAEVVDEKAFGDLNAVEMMDVLTRRLMHWQGQYGKFGEK